MTIEARIQKIVRDHPTQDAERLAELVSALRWEAQIEYLIDLQQQLKEKTCPDTK